MIPEIAKRRFATLWSVTSLALFAALPVTATQAERIVTVGGAVTEIAYLLGAGSRVVAIDETSLYPPAAQELPNVGYLRTLSPEPILALKPDLVLYTDDAGPPETLAQLKAAGVRMISVPATPSVAGTIEKIRIVARTLQRESEGDAAIAQLESDLAAAGDLIAAAGNEPRVLFAMQFDQGSVLAAGENTAADSIIRLAGGVNAAAGFQRYKPMGAEALLQARPDVVLAMAQTLEPFSRPVEVLELASLAHTPAARNQRLVVMDGLLLLGFGPRLGQAVRELGTAIHRVE